ncbi:hypothetical protein GCM10010915_12060 [Microbacterium faecale]|uniref:Uncharacterized protein n=1 Tax=Microbacterium faecale TaxID=1804630 RepID=A0A917DG83_9MICO|nr:hypothetical protein [Microbacterium faecale]GGD33266.1 hypothetical protein GCM10010915_12060 [Microbacterium faecale]
MNTEQLTALLARIQVLDNRQVDELTIQAWSPLMESVDYQAAVRAVNRHSVESTEYLKPAHIVRLVRDEQRAVTGGTMSPRREDCQAAGGEHRWLGGTGTCMFCEVRAL